MRLTCFCSCEILSLEAWEFWLTILRSSSCSFKVDTGRGMVGGEKGSEQWPIPSILRMPRLSLPPKLTL